MRRLREVWDDPQSWRHVHAGLTIAWGVAVIPTVLWLENSVLWVGLISCYANMVGHFSAWQATRAEKRSERDDN